MFWYDDEVKAFRIYVWILDITGECVRRSSFDRKKRGDGLAATPDGNLREGRRKAIVRRFRTQGKLHSWRRRLKRPRIINLLALNIQKAGTR